MKYPASNFRRPRSVSRLEPRELHAATREAVNRRVAAAKERSARARPAFSAGVGEVRPQQVMLCENARVGECSSGDSIRKRDFASASSRSGRAIGRAGTAREAAAAADAGSTINNEATAEVRAVRTKQVPDGAVQAR